MFRDLISCLNISRFKSNHAGNIAVMFGIALVPLMIAIGVGFDYSVAATDRTKLQGATDDAIIAVARATQSNPSITQAQQQIIVTNYLSGEVPLLNATISNFSVTSSGQITLDTTANVPRNLSRIIPGSSGLLTMPVGAHSQALATSPSLEVALVLDHTGSMSESAGGMTKIAAMQQAASNLLTAIMTSSTTQVAVIPFSSSVNAGTVYATASWVDTLGLSSSHWAPASGNGGDITKPSWATSRFDLFAQLGTSWLGCFETRPGTYATTDANPTLSTPDTLFVPMFAPSEPGNGQQQFTDKNLSTVYVTNSYLSDGAAFQGLLSFLPEKGTYDQIIKDPAKYKPVTGKVIGSSSFVSGMSVGPNFACDAYPLQRLTTSKTIAMNLINSLQANGDTNQLEGFTWGWRTLSPNGPFADGKSYSWNASNPAQPNKKVIILMTDGANHWLGAPDISPGSPSPYYGSIYSAMGYYKDNRVATGVTNETQSRSAIDAALQTACTNAKSVQDSNGNAAITVYTVGFSVPSDPIDSQGLALLQGCASTVGGTIQYYPATNSAQLITAFGLIAQNITTLRLSQ
jgi:Flp pilus assembly protein TadG